MNRQLPIALAQVVLGGMLCTIFGGRLGLIGFLLGVAGSGFNNAALWWVVKLMGSAGTENAPPRLGAILTVLAFVVKMPIFFALGFYSKGLGGAALPCFLVGLALVYFNTVRWALAAR